MAYNRAFREGIALKPTNSLLAALGLALALPVAAQDADAGLAAVRELGRHNGVALACAERDAAAQARQLMLAHAPKTARFGSAYEEATQESYLAQTRGGGACPDAKALAARIEDTAQRLRAALPAAK